jgi:hypothetical protein
MARVLRTIGVAVASAAVALTVGIAFGPNASADTTSRTSPAGYRAADCSGQAVTGRGYGRAGDLFALTGGRTLVLLDGKSLKARRTVKVNGLAYGERLVGIDVRPANKQLYGVGSSSRLYTVDPRSGKASPVGPQFTPALSGTRFGVDVNPVPDRIRVVSDAGQNLRLDPNTGQATMDTNLAYATGDSGAKAGYGPQVTAAGYTNSVAGATGTTLYGIDTRRDVLVLQGSKQGATPVVSPNTGQLTTVGRLGLRVDRLTGFDIANGSNAGIAAVRVEGRQWSRVVKIDLNSGRASTRAVLRYAVDGLTISMG